MEISIQNVLKFDFLKKIIFTMVWTKSSQTITREDAITTNKPKIDIMQSWIRK